MRTPPFAIAALLVAACSGPSPYDDVQVGMTKAEVLERFPVQEVFAVTCDGVTLFPRLDGKYAQCLAQPDAILIYRDTSRQYAYRFVADRVAETNSYDLNTYP